MRHLNSVKQLGKTYSHRKAMFRNMVTSLFLHERIVTTKQKGKELKRISEKLITRAKKNLNLPKDTDADAKKLHNKREVMKVIRDKDIIKKLFDNIAPRFKDRNGGYTRLYLLGKRDGDAAEMAIVELVEREESSTKKETEATVDKAKLKLGKSEKKTEAKEEKKDKEDKSKAKKEKVKSKEKVKDDKTRTKKEKGKSTKSKEEK